MGLRCWSEAGLLHGCPVLLLLLLFLTVRCRITSRNIVSVMAPLGIMLGPVDNLPKATFRRCHFDRGLGRTIESIPACLCWRTFLDEIGEDRSSCKYGEINLIIALLVIVSSIQKAEIASYVNLPDDSVQYVNAIWHKDTKCPP